MRLRELSGRLCAGGKMWAGDLLPLGGNRQSVLLDWWKTFLGQFVTDAVCELTVGGMELLRLSRPLGKRGGFSAL